jgi:hypothetical protein
MLRSTSRHPRQSGQIIILFVLSLTAIFAMAALLFDGAHALVLRRQLQNAGDAGALAGANVIQYNKGCSATAGPPPGAPRSAIVTVTQNAVRAVMPSVPISAIHVTCVADALWGNSAVQVDIDGHSPTFFGGAVGIRGFDVKTTSQAVNGQVAGLKYSIVELDPGNATWTDHTRQGCPSVGMGGGPTVTLEGSMQINSSCTAAGGGALYINGVGGQINLNNGATIRIVGGYVSNLPIVPAPTTGASPVRDPFAGIQAMPSTLVQRFATRQVYNGVDVLLHPGIYVGGIQLKSSARAFLEPGIYVMQGGGLDIGGQAFVYSVASGVTSTTDATWAANCPTASCGVLLYNTGTSGTFGPVTVGAGATLKLRPYIPTADGSGSGGVADYKNMLLWQDGNPIPSNTYAQPIVALQGGGSVDISGTVYAPSAVVTMGGGAGGSGGGTDVTLQFVSWDLQFQGNSSFHFYYRSDAFAKPTDYGLIK